MMRGLWAPSLVSSSNFPEVMITTAANTAIESWPLQQAAACADALLRDRGQIAATGKRYTRRCGSTTTRAIGAGWDTSEQNLPQPRWVSCDRGAGASAWLCALRYSDFSTKSLSALDSPPQTSPLRPASCRTLA